MQPRHSLNLQIERLYRQSGHVAIATHALSSNLNGQTVTLSATNNLTLETTNIQAEQNVNLNAGNNLALLSGKDQYYSLTESDHKGGALGTTSHGRDEVTSISHVGSSITSTQGDIAMISTGNQTLEAAHLNSAGNLTLTSTQGSISFNAVKDLLQESHEHSSVNLAWQSAQGQGSTNESIVQSHFAATGQTLINAAQGVNIAIGQVDAQSVHQTIAAMVSSDPSLAWLQAEETKGNVDWQQVKTIHDSWQYEQSGLGPGAALAVAIVMSIYAGPAGASMLLGDATVAAATVAGSAAAIEVSVVSAVAAGLATNATLSLISNKGDLGAVFADITSPDAIKGYITAGVTAGVTTGLITPHLSGPGVPGASAAQDAISHGFNLNTIAGVQGFATYTAAQALAGATINTAINGGSFGDNLSNGLQGAAVTTAGAALFNAVGSYASDHGFAEGSPQKVILHALVGGALSVASGGDFATGAMAAGVNEAVADKLATLVSNDPKLTSLVVQLTGIATTTLTGGDVNIAANVANMGDLYNRQLHPSELPRAKTIANNSQGKYTQKQIEDAMRWLSYNTNDYHEDISTGMTVTADNSNNPNYVYDKNTPFTINADGTKFYQQLPMASKEVMQYVIAQTGGSSSPYWTAGLMQTPVATVNVNVNVSPFGDGWNYMGANSAGLSGMPPVDNRTQAQIDADQNRFAIGVATLPLAVVPFIPTKAIIAIGAGTGGVFDVAGQYVDTNGFTTGDWRPMQTTVSVITGGASAPYAVGYGVIGNTLLGTGVSTANAGFNNWYYSNDPTYKPKDLWEEAGKGALGGVAGYYTGGLTTNYFTTPIIRNQSILFQNYNNPMPSLIGNTVGGSVSGATPIVIDYLNQDKQK